MKVQILSLSLFTVLIIGAFQPSHAQESQKAAGIEIELDPFAYLLSGYSFHVAYTYSHFRTSLGVYGIKQPDIFLSNDAFSVNSSGYDVKTDYLFGQLKGFFLGAQLTYGKDRIGLKNEQAREDHWGVSYGLRTGYRFMFGKEEKDYKGLYVVPWFAIMYAPGADSIQMGGEQYKQTSWIPFPTLHVGWRF